MFKAILIGILLLGSLWLPTCVLAETEPPQVTVDGLHRVEGTELDLVYALPGAALSAYQRVFLLRPEVRFVKDYKRKVNAMYSNRMTDHDVEQLREAVADGFVAAFQAALQQEPPYELVQEAAEDVLVVRPAIIDLDVLAPAAVTRPNQRSALPSAGRMTLYMELVDSVSGAVLVKALDYEYDRTRVQTYLDNRTRNEAAARQILDRWAGILRSGLDEARRRAGRDADLEQ